MSSLFLLFSFMVEFTNEILACWLLEGYTNIIYRAYTNRHYATLTPSREEMPVDMQLFFQVVVYRISDNIVSDFTVTDKDGFKYYVGEDYEHYRNFDADHIDTEADY